MMNNNLTYREAYKDAGLLREYIARHYGAALTYGALSATYWRAWALCGQLARLAGLTRMQVVNDIRADYAVLSA